MSNFDDFMNQEPAKPTPVNFKGIAGPADFFPAVENAQRAEVEGSSYYKLSIEEASLFIAADCIGGLLNQPDPYAMKSAAAYFGLEPVASLSGKVMQQFIGGDFTMDGQVPEEELPPLLIDDAYDVIVQLSREYGYATIAAAKKLCELHPQLCPNPDAAVQQIAEDLELDLEAAMAIYAGFPEPAEPTSELDALSASLVLAMDVTADSANDEAVGKVMQRCYQINAMMALACRMGVRGVDPNNKTAIVEAAKDEVIPTLQAADRKTKLKALGIAHLAVTSGMAGEPMTEAQGASLAAYCDALEITQQSMLDASAMVEDAGEASHSVEALMEGLAKTMVDTIKDVVDPIVEGLQKPKD